MTTQQVQSPSTSRVVVESVSSGRLIALLVAAVGLSVLTSILVSTEATTTMPDEVAATEPATQATVGSDSAGGSSGAGGSVDDVLPALVARADLALVPDGEVNVAIAPEMPPPSGRTAPAVIDVAFEVVENVSTIDPATGTQFETWGYRVVDGDDGLVVGHPARSSVDGSVTCCGPRSPIPPAMRCPTTSTSTP